MVHWCSGVTRHGSLVSGGVMSWYGRFREVPCHGLLVLGRCHVMVQWF